VEMARSANCTVSADTWDLVVVWCPARMYAAKAPNRAMHSGGGGPERSGRTCGQNRERKVVQAFRKRRRSLVVAATTPSSMAVAAAVKRTCARGLLAGGTSSNSCAGEGGRQQQSW
jgi:hypothetical protein